MRRSPTMVLLLCTIGALSCSGAAESEGPIATSEPSEAAAPAEAVSETPSGDQSPATTVPDDRSSGVTQDEILVGWMGDITGPTAGSQAGNLAGTRAYFDYVND